MSQSALPPNDQEMTLVQHLLDLRNTVTRAILAIIVVFVILFPFANDLYVYISEPLSRFLPEGTSMIATGVASPFLTPFKLSLVLAIYLAMPFLLYQLWTFIAPALYKHERQLIAPLLFFSSFLFYAGGAFAYYVVFPLVFGFLSTTAPEGVTIATDIALYLDFVIKMFFAFGMAFEVPIVVVLLILTGMVSPKKMSHARPYIVVGAFIIGMLLTPPDIISQTLLAIPMWLLYEAGIIVGSMVLKARKKNTEAEPEEPQTDTASESTETHQTTATSETSTSNTDDYAFDDRYADQLDDDADWDSTFDEIDSEFAQLEADYLKRQQAEKDAEAAAQKQKDSSAKEGNDDDLSGEHPSTTQSSESTETASESNDSAATDSQKTPKTP